MVGMCCSISKCDCGGEVSLWMLLPADHGRSPPDTLKQEQKVPEAGAGRHLARFPAVGGHGHAHSDCACSQPILATQGPGPAGPCPHRAHTPPGGQHTLSSLPCLQTPFSHHHHVTPRCAETLHPHSVPFWTATTLGHA